jgi:uncharacterized integral membrane protein
MSSLELLPESPELDKMEKHPGKEELSMQLFLIVALGLAILTGIFALQNAIPVGVTFLFWKFEGSLALVLMLTFALGVLVGSLASIPAIVKEDRQFQIRRRI